MCRWLPATEAHPKFAPAINAMTVPIKINTNQDNFV
jgi:hypothetical protein